MLGVLFIVAALAWKIGATALMSKIQNRAGQATANSPEPQGEPPVSGLGSRDVVN